MRKFKFLYPLTVLLALACLCWVGMAQTTGSASLRGTVKDPTGAVVPGADITLTNTATQDVRTAVSDAQGLFFFGALRPGTYTLRAELPGFKVYEQTNLTINAAQTAGVDVPLQLGETTETVTVTSATEYIKTETPAKEDTITSEQIDNLSIISRSSLELMRIMPGVVAPDADQLESVSFGGGANANNAYNVNGLRGQFNNVQIDGARMIDIGSNNGTMLTANPEMVQEVTVQTSNYSAEHGTSGVQITAITKGGTSEFHGTAYYYFRDYRLAANDRSRNYAGIERPKSSYKYPGFNVGGPVLIPGTNFNQNRDKLFFFMGLEFQRQQVDTGAQLGVVPTLKQRVGDFSEFLANEGSNLGQPTTVNIPQGYDGAGSAAPNNNIAPYIHPWGSAFANLYPTPNLTTPNNRYNYAYSALAPTNRNQLLLRFDYNFNDNTKLYVRLGREYEDIDMARGIWWDASRFELPSHVLGTNLGRSISGNMVQVLSPTTTNELLISASKLKLDNDYKDPDSMRLSAVGIDDYDVMFDPSLIRNDYVPIAFYAWGQGLGEFWSPGGLPMFAHNDSISLTDNFNKVLDAHALKFGVTVEQANKKQNFNGDDEGAYQLGSTWTPGNTGSDYGDLLVGRIAAFGQSTSTAIGHWRFWNVEMFVQDNWKIRPGLTLELGMRVGYMPNNYERDGLDVNFVPSFYQPGEGTYPGGDVTRPNGIRLAKLGEIPKGISQNPGLLWMPRVGFAWDLRGDGGFVLRAGGGIFYNRPQGNTQYWVIQDPPNKYNASMDTWSGTGLGGGEGLTYNTIREIDPYSRLGSVDIHSQQLTELEMPRIASMSLSLASRLPYDQVFEVAYVGTQGRHLSAQRNTNIIPEGTFLSGTIGNADMSIPVHRAALNDQVRATYLPYPAFGAINNVEFSTTSVYHSLQATLRRQAGERLQYYATYTFSKVLGALGGDFGSIDPLDTRGRYYGILDWDRTHIFNLSYTYQIPSLATGNFRNGFTSAVFDGWQMSGITTFQAGTPIRLQLAGAIRGNAMERAWFGSDAYLDEWAIAPVYTCNPYNSSASGVGEKIMDLSCLSIPAFGETGPQQPPYYMRTPSRWNFDVSFFKDFDFGEDRRLQFRAGMFNIFNSAYPRGIGTGGDVRMELNTECLTRVNGVPNGAGGVSDDVCDPTGGFAYTDLTQQEFGEITTKHGKRIIELALKFYF